MALGAAGLLGALGAKRVIEQDDFEAWRVHPVTEAVNKALVILAERNKQKWIDTSWDGGVADPVVLAELKARYEVALDLSELTFEELEQALDDEPKRNTTDRVQGADPAG